MYSPSPLPRPLEVVRITPFYNGSADTGRFLVEAGSREFVVSRAASQLILVLREFAEPSDVRRALRERMGEDLTDAELRLAVERLPRALFEKQAGRSEEDHFLLRFRLLSASAVQGLARRLQHAFDIGPAIFLLAAMALCLPFGLAAMGTPAFSTGLDLGSSGLLLFALVLSVGAHELGHAAACQRFGVDPGHIGFGLYWVFPVFYADVTRAWRLRPHQRVIVDLGGLYFQGLLLLLAVPLLLYAPADPAVQLFYFYNVGMMVHNLNPVFKMDGYWLLADLTRMPNLHRRTLAWMLQAVGIRTPAPLTMDRRMQWVAGAYAALIVACFAYWGFCIPRWVEFFFLPELRAAAGEWRLAGDHLSAGSWLAAVAGILRGVPAFVAAGLPLIAVPWGVWKMSAAIRKMTGASFRTE